MDWLGMAAGARARAMALGGTPALPQRRHDVFGAGLARPACGVRRAQPGRPRSVADCLPVGPGLDREDAVLVAG